MNEFVVEYNVLSRCSGKAYSAVILNVSDFDQDTFDDMFSHKQFDEYYLEQNLEGMRKNGQMVWYDRAWVRTEKSPQEFVKFLEDRL